MARRLEESPSLCSLSVELSLVPEDGVDRVWPLIAPILTKPLATTKKSSLESIRRQALEGSVQIWAAHNEEEVKMSCVTEIVTYPNEYKTARILLLGGHDMGLWKGLMPIIEDWAAKNGCEAVEIAGRRGWGRVYPEYLVTEYCFVKEI